MRYVVKDTHIRHGAGQDARTYGPGDEIELTEDEAERLGASIEPVKGPSSPVEPKKKGK